MCGLPTNRVVLITGASSGIGRETALAFAERGDIVCAVARRPDRLAQLHQTARAFHLAGEIMLFPADVRDQDEMHRIVDKVMALYGRLNVLVANAGIGQRGSIVDSKWDDLDAVLRTNLDGALHSVRAAVPAMRRFKNGHIIFVSSVVSIAVTPYASVYAASKAALNVLARGLREELRPDGIWVTTMLVGQTESEFAESRRGVPGKISAGIPTMKVHKVADAIVQEAGRRRRVRILRPFDRALVVAGAFFPRLLDRIAARFYR